MLAQIGLQLRFTAEAATYVKQKPSLTTRGTLMREQSHVTVTVTRHMSHVKCGRRRRISETSRNFLTCCHVRPHHHHANHPTTSSSGERCHVWPLWRADTGPVRSMNFDQWVGVSVQRKTQFQWYCGALVTGGCNSACSAVGKVRGCWDVPLLGDGQ